MDRRGAMIRGERLCYNVVETTINWMQTTTILTRKKEQWRSNDVDGFGVVINPAEFHWLSLAFDPLNAKLNPICHLLALLEAHHILHVSRIRVNQTPILYRNTKYKTKAVGFSSHDILRVKVSS
jgi:hypothetical protein